VPGITDAEFGWIKNFLLQQSGIELRPGKEALVVGRLERRLRHHRLNGFTAYCQLLAGPDAGEEVRTAVDLLTTNETYFFREPTHFDRLPELLPAPAAAGDRAIRVWSAASSTGEEAFTIALTLADQLGERRWEVLGTDISARVLETATRGLYPIEAATQIPDRLLKAHCLKGKDSFQGLFTLRPALRSRVSFRPANLTRQLPELGLFDVVFLRNVMIYFGLETKRLLIERIRAVLRPGGYLLVGHAESLTGIDGGLRPVVPSVYQNPGD
jgi:chemotaxis protein methyltransferase CheR